MNKCCVHSQKTAESPAKSHCFYSFLGRMTHPVLSFDQIEKGRPSRKEKKAKEGHR